MAYSMDVRKRVLRAWGAGLDAESVAAKDDVSRAWVHRLVQRQRETGLIAPPPANALSPTLSDRTLGLLDPWTFRP
jgi:transposase